MVIVRYAFLALALVALAAGESLAQNSITNTLGASGAFRIKDATSDFFSVSQASGNALFYRNIELGNLTASSATAGGFTKNGMRFIHNYGGPGNEPNNTFVGVFSGNFSLGGANPWEGTANTGIGYFALSSLTTGNQNCALGSQALGSNTTGTQNSAIGVAALASNVNGGWNVAVGLSSLYANISGVTNTAVGTSSLNLNVDGNGNSAFGYQAGSTVTSGSNLTMLGYTAWPSSATASNEVTLGNSSVTTLRCNTQTITTLSDARDKKNIRELSVGLGFLMKVKPRLFNWDRREWYMDNKSDGSKMEQGATAGFIAQELDEVQSTEHAEWLRLVLKSNPAKLEASAGNLFPVMVKAIQELKKEKDAEIAELKKANEILEQRLLAQGEAIESLKELTSKLAAGARTDSHASVVRDVTSQPVNMP